MSKQLTILFVGDVVGSPGFWDNFRGHSLYVDLAGSTNQFGALTSKSAFAPSQRQSVNVSERRQNSGDCWRRHQTRWW